MRDIQTVFGYFYTVYALAALIFGGYAVALYLNARKAKSRLDAAKR